MIKHFVSILRKYFQILFQIKFGTDVFEKRPGMNFVQGTSSFTSIKIKSFHMVSQKYKDEVFFDMKKFG